MSRDGEDRLQDILEACEAIARYSRRADAADEVVFDAIRIRLIEIGEAVKGLDPGLLADEPDIPWRTIAGMRDKLAHRYFDTTHAIVMATARHDIPELSAAARRLLAASG